MNKKKQRILWITSAAVIVIAIVAIMQIIQQKDFEAALEKVKTKYSIQWLAEYDANDIETIMPERAWTEYARGRRMTKEEAKDVIRESSDARKYRCQREYGDYISLSFNALNEGTFDKERLDIIGTYIEYEYYIPSESVEAIYEVELEVTLHGSEVVETQTVTEHAVKIDGEWYHCWVSENMNARNLFCFMNSDYEPELFD